MSGIDLRAADAFLKKLYSNVDFNKKPSREEEIAAELKEEEERSWRGKCRTCEVKIDPSVRYCEGCWDISQKLMYRKPGIHTVSGQTWEIKKEGVFVSLKLIKIEESK